MSNSDRKYGYGRVDFDRMSGLEIEQDKARIAQEVRSAREVKSALAAALVVERNGGEEIMEQLRMEYAAKFRSGSGSRARSSPADIPLPLVDDTPLVTEDEIPWHELKHMSRVPKEHLWWQLVPKVMLDRTKYESEEFRDLVREIAQDEADHDETPSEYDESRSHHPDGWGGGSSED